MVKRPQSSPCAPALGDSATAGMPVTVFSQCASRSISATAPGVVAPGRGVDGLGLSAQAATALAKTEGRKNAVPASQKATAAAWQAWIGKQHTAGRGAVPDYANPAQMNRYTWYQAHGWKAPYPG